MLKWVENERGNFYSFHHTIKHHGEDVPKYYILKINENWFIGEYYPFYSEYVPLNESHEMQQAFKTSLEAMKHIDKIEQ